MVDDDAGLCRSRHGTELPHVRKRAGKVRLEAVAIQQ
jgi:hypothetical protein